MKTADLPTNTTAMKYQFTGKKKVDFEEVEERFLIMTAESDVDDITACKYIQSKYGRENAIKILEKYCKK